MQHIKSSVPTHKQNNLIQVAVALHQSGQLAAAEKQYRKLLAVLPSHTLLLSNLGTIAIQNGDLETAVKLFESSLLINPSQVNTLYSCGVALKDLRRLDQALARFNRAITLVPDYIDAYFIRSITLYELNRLVDALESFDEVIALKPDYADAHFNRGVVLHELKRLDEALDAYKHTITLMPAYFSVYYKCGLILQELNRLDEALAYYDCAIALNPDYADAYFNRGNTLCGLKRLDEALENYDLALALNPDHAVAFNIRGNVLQHLNRLNEALVSFDHVISLKPDHAEAYSNRANVLHDLKRYKEAEFSCRLALQIDPEFAQAHNNLGLTLLELGCLEDAEASFLMAIKYNSNLAEAYNGLGVVSSRLGRLNSEYFKKSLAISPEHSEIFSNWLFNASMSASLNASDLLAEHLLYGDQYEAHLRADWQSHKQNKDPQRCLQIGFVSGDFCDHAIASFVEPLLIHLSQISSLSLHAYYTHIQHDNVSQRLQGYFAYWTPVVGLSDDELSDKIRADSIDILIDLSGHTAHNRLVTFARKPAPIQASWMGYPGTTGLQAMDYYLADKNYLPQELFKDQFTEKLVYLPATAPFMPYESAPEVNDLPALSNGYITFGSFNRLNKLNSGVVEVWAKLMQAVPTSKLIIAGMPESGYDSLISWFTGQGVLIERLSFYTRSNMVEYLVLHHQVDICLDTFPYNGGTTTCHAISMGVPTLTMVGQTPASRSGCALMLRLELDDFVSHSAEDFVNKGLSLANNLERLSEIRKVLRIRFELSAFQRPELIAKGLDRVLRLMWQRWCKDLPPISLDVSDTQIN
jgi:predicted O-linked N-acetylglucosamine transferase (SPINDLY family)